MAEQTKQPENVVIEKEPADKPSERPRHAGGPLYEVMVDLYGSDPVFRRGDLIRASDAPDFDLAWAVDVGAIRFAPEFEGRNLASTTRPLDADGRLLDPTHLETGEERERRAAEQVKANNEAAEVARRDRAERQRRTR